ncbi:MAG: bifunctional cobalt-precorrin-7 (C(5))-methyltransferase/cobalt-precorrin-6B (C(15))-methyltransferase [Desulfotalea sp.]|nr:MAG: bifunctional cobalt-precorrin-7 (C(5))-methyltransferase/cobalt-precorrin-6B (C(15))-methyltransferase [Desulfotalea sp.]
MFDLFVIGVADNMLSKANKATLALCSHVFATQRLQNIISDLPIEMHNISPVTETVATIKDLLNSGNVAVLASGDPLFYGIGKKFLLEFPAKNIHFYPGLSSVQRACALFKTNWDDATILSLHGRNNQHIPGLILPHAKCILLTDATNNPTEICKNILDYLLLIKATNRASDITVMVAENIGLTDQRLFSGSLTDASRETFSPLNILLIQTPYADQTNYPASFGLTEEEVVHSRGLITKSEVRAATIHQLRLPQTGVLWDVGAGSGSISIEAARSHPELTIFAIEHKQEELANIKANIRKFGCYNIIPVFGKAPDCLAPLPAPDRIFIGGSSGTLPALTEIASRLLPVNGRIVINGVIEKTITEAPKLLAGFNFITTSTTIHVTRTDSSMQTVPFNPITITTGSR